MARSMGRRADRLPRVDAPPNAEAARDGVEAVARRQREQMSPAALCIGVRPTLCTSPDASAEAERRASAPLPGSGAMIVGTAGHIDHGKTSLVRALTGVDTDRLKEEKARGISIDLGFAYLPAPDGDDARLRRRARATRSSCTTCWRARPASISSLLVVAADDGVMPQTREHLAIVDLLGHRARHRRADQVRSRRRRTALRRSTAEISATLAGTSARPAAEIVPVSAVDRRGHRRAARPICSTPAATPRQRAPGRALPARRRPLLHARRRRHGGDRHRAVGRGRGRRPRRRSARPDWRRACARSTPRTGRPNAARPASAARSILRATASAKDAIRRGDVVLDPDAARADRPHRCDAALAASRAEADRPMDAGAAASCGGRGRRAASCCSATSRSRPASEALVQLVLEQPIAAAAGDRFVLRDTTAQRTIGGGRFLDLRAPARKRRTPERHGAA